MTFLAGLMWLDGEEIFNNGRTLANMEAARAAGTLPRNFIFNSTDDCDCDAYWLNPTIPCGPFTSFFACGPDCITADTLNSLNAENPWHDDDIAESDEFLGVWVDAVEGLDGRHNARNTTARQAYPRGSILSPLKPTHRTVSYELTLVATSDCGLDFGMQWLEQALASAACHQCDLSEMVIRSCCPPTDDPEYGIWVLKEVGLAEGPEWGEALTDQTMRYARQATVSFYAGNPCRFSKPESCTVSESLYDDWHTGAGSLQFRCCLIPASSKAYNYTPIVTVVVPPGGDSWPFRLTAWPHYAGTGNCSSAGSNFNRLDNSMIGTPLMLISIASLPADHTLTIDASLREIRISGPTTDYVEIDGSAYVDATAGFVNWGALPCDEEISLAANISGDFLTYVAAFAAFIGHTGPYYAPPAVSIATVKRGGC